MSVWTPDEESLDTLNRLLLHQPYVRGFFASDLDTKLYQGLREKSVVPDNATQANLARSGGDSLDFNAFLHTNKNLFHRWYNHYQSFGEREISQLPQLENVNLETVIDQFRTMTLGGDNGLSAQEKKALITRNLQETLGEDRIEEVRFQHSCELLKLNATL